jgi:hypothetical protein
MLNLSLSGGMPAMQLATVIAQRHPSVMPEGPAALIRRQQQKRRDEFATLAALEVIWRGRWEDAAEAARSGGGAASRATSTALARRSGVE